MNGIFYRLQAWILLSWCLTSFIGCHGRVPPDEAAARGIPVSDEAAEEYYPMAARDFFAGMDGTHDPLGPPQPEPSTPGQTRPLILNAQEIKGRNAWMMWTGGNEAFWDWLARFGYGSIDLLHVIDSDVRSDRFERAGLIPEPGMRPPTKEETELAFGVRYDRPIDANAPKPDPKVYGYSSGIVGLRLYPNPEFKGRAKTQWDHKRYYNDTRYSTNPSTVRPFRVGMSCAFCHAAPDPLRPPKNPEQPEWANLSATIGNQYLRVREVLGNMLEKDSYLYHVIDSQFPGTIDTSLIASDNINNANTMNAVFGLSWRVDRSLLNPFEKLDEELEGYPGVFGKRPAGVALPDFDANPRPIPRVLVDGSDSVGAYLSFARVYLNIGTYHQQWVRVHNPVLGFRSQSPFKLADVESNSVYWKATKLRVDPTIAYFLTASSPMLMKDAPKVEGVSPQGEAVPWSSDYAEGRRVYANGCIACHSSFQPGDNPALEDAIPAKEAYEVAIADRKSLRLSASDLARLARGDGELPPGYAAWAQAAVKQKVFWERNYLSTDMRVPVTLMQTNSGRAVATNAMHDHVWEDFSSFTYKELPPVGQIKYFDPFAQMEKTFEPPGGGPGYYRPPSLISVWATAPYLHNNSLGLFNNDPSVAGRYAAFKDGIEKLLSPEKRLASHDRGTVEKSDDVAATQLANDHALIWRTSDVSTLTIFGHQIPGMLSGLTGWTPGSVRVIPWIPALLYLTLGLILFFIRPLTELCGRIRKKLANFAPVISYLSFGAAAALIVIGIVAALYAYKFYPAMEVVEQTSGWIIPWVRIQVALLILFFFITATLIGLEYLPGISLFRRWNIYLGAGAVAAAFMLAAGLGMFASGNGGDLSLGPFPKGMPVNLITNIDPKASTKDIVKAFDALLTYFRDYRSANEQHRAGLAEFENRVAPLFMRISKCPDFGLDKGHDLEFIRNLTNQEKQALTELLKTF
jgi:cytochrome c5